MNDITPDRPGTSIISTLMSESIGERYIQQSFKEEEAARVATFTGSAVAQVRGNTIHSLLKLNPKASACSGVRCVIIRITRHVSRSCHASDR